MNKKKIGLGAMLIALAILVLGIRLSSHSGDIAQSDVKPSDSKLITPISNSKARVSQATNSMHIKTSSVSHNK
ncbi:MAG: hypothetical protein ACRBHB_09870 [Arenicella sp.]